MGYQGLQNYYTEVIVAIWSPESKMATKMTAKKYKFISFTKQRRVT